MQINTDRERYLELLHSGDLWTRRKEQERRLLTSNDIAELRDELDACDQQPARDPFHVYWAGVITGAFYAAALCWLVFGRR